MTLVNRYKDVIELNLEDYLSGTQVVNDLGTGTLGEVVSQTALDQTGSATLANSNVTSTSGLDTSANSIEWQFNFSSNQANSLLTTANLGSENKDTDTNTGSTNWISQIFKLPVNTNVTEARIYARFDSGSDANARVHIRIETDDGGNPSGSIVTGGSALVPFFTGSPADATYAFRTGSFSNAPSLTANTTYHLLVHASGAQSGSVFKYGEDSSSPTYSSGNKLNSTDGGSNWTDVSTSDMIFEIYGNKINENGVFISGTTVGSLVARNQHSAITKDTDTEVRLTYNVGYEVLVNQ